jgi:hypothetical protein
MVTWQPETVEMLSARYPEAVKEVNFGQFIPALFRRHVFDFSDGLRVVISRDALPGNPYGVHLSCSIWPATSLEISSRARSFKAQQFQRWFQEICERRFQRYFNVKATFRHWSEAGIPHWFVRREDDANWIDPDSVDTGRIVKQASAVHS